MHVHKMAPLHCVLCSAQEGNRIVHAELFGPVHAADSQQAQSAACTLICITFIIPASQKNQICTYIITRTAIFFYMFKFFSSERYDFYIIGRDSATVVTLT